GATPVLVDVEPGTYTMAPRELLRILRSPPAGRPSAVLPVHIYGQPAELSELTEIARAFGLRLIEDCAQSHGAVHCGKRVGSFGDIACFSFYPTKNLGALGDGVNGRYERSLARCGAARTSRIRLGRASCPCPPRREFAAR